MTSLGCLFEKKMHFLPVCIQYLYCELFFSSPFLEVEVYKGECKDYQPRSCKDKPSLGKVAVSIWFNDELCDHLPVACLEHTSPICAYLLIIIFHLFLRHVIKISR